MLLIVGLSTPRTAHGRPADKSAETAAKARELYESGRQALATHDHLTAYRWFSQAFRLQPNADSLFYLASLAFDEGKRVAAEDLLRRYLSDPTLSQSPEAMSRQSEAQRMLAQLASAPPLESGEVSVLNDRAAFVLVDDRLVGQVPLSQPLLVPAGPHKISLEQSGAPLEAELTVPPGRTVEVRFNRTTGAVIVSLPPALLLLNSFATVAPEAQQRLELSIAQAVRRERLAPLRKEATLQRFPKLAPCLTETPCQAELATNVEADYALIAKIDSSKSSGNSSGNSSPAPAAVSGTWHISLGLLDAKVADVAALEARECAPCTVEQAATRVEEMIEQVLGRGLSRTRGTLELSSSPPGVEVRLGERKLGETPYKHALFTGSYTLSLRKPGFLPKEESISIEAEQTASREVRLILAPPDEHEVPRPPPILPRQPRPLWRIIAGSAGIAAGALFIGFGAKALAVDNTCIDDPTPPRTICAKLYDTTGIGGALTATGAVLTIAGITLIAFPGSRPRSTGRRSY